MAAPRPEPRHLVVIGASAGGVEALSEIVAALPDTLEAAVFVVLHMAPGSTSSLAGILARAGRLPVSVGVDGAPVRRGTICVAPPSAHLSLEDGVVRVDDVGVRDRLDPHVPHAVPTDRFHGVSSCRSDGTRISARMKDRDRRPDFKLS